MTDVAVTVGRRSDRVSISKKITRARNAPARWMDDPLSARPTRRGSSPKFFRPEDPPTGKASKASPKTPRASASYGGGGGAPPRRELRKKPSRALKTAGKIGDKKPIKGIYESRECVFCSPLPPPPPPAHSVCTQCLQMPGRME